MIRNLGLLVIGWLCLWWSGTALGQGTGPNLNFLTPTGLNTFSISILEVNSNFRFGQTQFGEFAFDTNTATFNHFYRFSLFNRLALVGYNLHYVDISATAKFELPDIPNLPNLPGFLPGDGSGRINRSGFSDPTVTFRQGIIGTPALPAQEWLAYQQGFQLSGQLSLRLPWGDYDDRRIINPGFNRLSVDLSLPMVIPVDGASRKTFLEFTPKVLFFDDNTQPPRGRRVSEQEELFVGEIHLLHQLSKKTFLSLGAQYQNGGGTVVDGIALNNSLDQWFGEVAIGYVINKHFSFAVTYGEIFGSSNGARGDAWRFRLGMAL